MIRFQSFSLHQPFTADLTVVTPVGGGSDALPFRFSAHPSAIGEQTQTSLIMKGRACDARKPRHMRTGSLEAGAR